MVYHALDEAFKLQKPPSKDRTHREKPLVEMANDMTTEGVYEPLTIESTSRVPEKTYIERTNNSTRISFLIKQSDTMDETLCLKFMRSLMRRAEDYYIVRRIPVKGFSITFLVTNIHLAKFKRRHILDFIIYFMQEVDKEISEMKISVNARARKVASDFMDLLSRY